MNAHFADVTAMQKDYSDALDESGIHTLLDADRVAKDTEFKESRTILADARKVVDDFSRRSKQMIEALPEKFDRKSFSSANRASMRRGMEKELDVPRKIDAEIWGLEMASVNHMEELIDHLQEKRKLWQAQDGSFLFERDEDVEKYNGIMEEVTACVTKQEEIRERARDSASGKLGEMKETLSK